MRGNPLKNALRPGGQVFGTMVMEFFTPRLPQIVRAAGAELALFDMEHTGASLETMKAQLAACRGIGPTPIIRAPILAQHYISRSHDIGAMGIMIPMVDSAAEAREIVAATHYPPGGCRGAVFMNAHDDYQGGSVAEKMAAADERTLVIAQFETREGLEAVDEIAAVGGVDVVWLGHFDLTNFMGIPGEVANPDYLHAVDAWGRG